MTLLLTPVHKTNRRNRLGMRGIRRRRIPPPKTIAEVKLEVVEASLEQAKERVEVLENLLITHNHEMSLIEADQHVERERFERRIRSFETQLRAANKKVDAREQKLKELPAKIRTQEGRKHDRAMAKQADKLKVANKKVTEANKKMRKMAVEEVQPLQATVAQQKLALSKLRSDFAESLRTNDKLKKTVKSQQAKIDKFNETKLTTQRENAQKKLEVQLLQVQKKQLDLQMKQEEKKNKEELLETAYRLRNEKARADFQLKAEAKAKEQEDRANRLKNYVDMRDQQRTARTGQFPAPDTPTLDGTEPSIAEAMAAFYREQAAKARQATTSPTAAPAATTTAPTPAASVPAAASLPTPVASNQTVRTPRATSGTKKKKKASTKKSSAKKSTPRAERNLAKGQLTLTQMAESVDSEPETEEVPSSAHLLVSPSLVPGYNVVLNELTRDYYYENITTGETTREMPTAPAGSVVGGSVGSDGAVNGLDVTDLATLADGMTANTAVDLIDSDNESTADTKKPSPEEKAKAKEEENKNDTDDNDSDSDDSSVDVVTMWRAAKARAAAKAEANRKQYQNDGNDDDEMKDDDNDDEKKEGSDDTNIPKKLF